MKLQKRLTLAFIITVLLATTLVAAAAGLSTRHFFLDYLNENRLARTEQWQGIFAAYYDQTGSWSRVQETFFGRGMMPGGGTGWMGRNRNAVEGETIILANADGIVIADSSGTELGQQFRSDNLQLGAAITKNNRVIGTVMVSSQVPIGLASLADEFSASVQRAILLGGITASLLAAALGIVLSKQLIRPLTALTEAVNKYSRRDFSQRAAIRSADEIGELAVTFNAMAESGERYEKLRRNLLADVAHELRTPLAILQGNLELLQAGVAKPDTVVITSLQEEVLRMARLVNDLQEVSLAEAGALALNLTPIEAGELLERVLPGLRAEATGKGISLTAEIKPDLSLIVDPDRITQVTLNLAGNALRYTPAGGQITLRAYRTGPMVAFEIRDTGPGIDPADLPYIFDRFYRSDKARTRSGGGAGLGLAIAKGLVEAHGGTIRAESRPGEGATFTFTVPAGGK